MNKFGIVSCGIDLIMTSLSLTLVKVIQFQPTTLSQVIELLQITSSLQKVMSKILAQKYHKILRFKDQFKPKLLHII